MRRLLASWRVALRLARRDVVRARGRSALVAVLIGLPMVLAGYWEVSTRSGDVRREDVLRAYLGAHAEAWIQTADPERPVRFSFEKYDLHLDTTQAPAAGPRTGGRDVDAVLRATVPARDEVVFRRSVADVLVRGAGRVGVVGVVEWDYRRLPDLIRQVSGRAPSGPGEVVVEESFARDHGVPAGTVLSFGAPPTAGTLTAKAGPAPANASQQRTGTVVGTYRARQTDVDRLPSVVTFPGTLPVELSRPRAGDTQAQWWVIGPDPVTPAHVKALAAVGLATISRHASLAVFGPIDDGVARDTFLGRPELAVAAGVAVGMLLLQIALMAGPAMAVGARRSEQTLALVAACGGHRPQLRRQVLATGLVTGTIGSAVGVTVGATIAVLGRGPGEPAPFRQPLHLDVVELAALVAVGAGIAVAAALLPARQASRMDVVAALGGRPAISAPRRRVPVLGLVAVGVGSAVALWGGTAVRPSVVAVGAAISELGLVAATGTVVALAARAAARFPFAVRLALRDAARHRSRTVPAIAATMAAIAAATAWLLVGASSREGYDAGAATPPLDPVVVAELPSEQRFPVVRDWAAVEAAIRQALPARAGAVLRQGVGDDAVVEIVPRPCPSPTGRATCASDPRAGREDLFLGTDQWVDDGSTLDIAIHGRDPGAVRALRSGRSVVWNPRFLGSDGMVVVRRSGHLVELPGYLSTGPEWSSGIVLSEDAARRTGITVAPTKVVVSLTRPPDAAELGRARSAMVRTSGAFFQQEPLRAVPELAAGGDGGVPAAGAIIAALVALGGVLAAVSLVAAEGRADRATLAAVGGPPGLRRRVAAAQALVIAGVGAVMGLVAGCAGGYAVIRYVRQEWFAQWPRSVLPLVVPWPSLLALVVGVPLVAAAVSALGTRSRLELVRRRGA